MKYYFRIARYTLEKELLLKFTHIHENDFGIVLPANILVYYEKSLVQYIQNINKSYFVDPMTYIFTNHQNMFKTSNGNYELEAQGTYKLKKSYEKLIIQYYKDLETNFKTDYPLKISYFSDPEKITLFAENTLSYQENTLLNNLDKISKYELLLGEKVISPQNILPEFLTSPYFYFSDFLDPWYNINVLLSNESKAIRTNKDVYAIICMNKSLLSRKSAIKIANDFSAADGFILFISDFDEKSELENMLKNYITFVNVLFQESQKPIINMYGTFFSCILKFFGLVGNSSGLCILDHRNANAVYTTGRTYLNFYLPSVYDKISEQNYRTYLVKYNPLDECNCKICRDLSQLKEKVDSIIFQRYIDRMFISNRGELGNALIEHFLFNRLKEMDHINKEGFKNIIGEMDYNISMNHEYDRLISLNNNPIRWKHALT